MSKKHFFLILPVCFVLCMGITACADTSDDFPPNSDLWSQIRNTAWTKVGDTKPTLGFYAPNKGPEARDYYYDPSSEYNTPYVIYRYIPDDEGEDAYWYDEWNDEYHIAAGGTSYQYIKINRDGNKICNTWDDVMFNISVSDNGYELTVKFPKSSGNSPDVVWGYDGGRITEGTYIKTSSDPNFIFDDGEYRANLWRKIQNTAWIKEGNSKPSIGFYDYDDDNWRNDDAKLILDIPLGTSSVIYEDTFDTSGNLNYFGISSSGRRIMQNGLEFNILVIDNGNKLVIADFRGRFWLEDDNYNYDDYDSATGMRWYDNFNYSENKVSNSVLRPHFNGVYTKSSVVFDEDRKTLLEKIRNTAWTKQGESKPSIGFYEEGKGPDNSLVFNNSNNYGYVHFEVRADLCRTGEEFQINFIGNQITCGGQIFDIAVTNNGNTLTISNLRHTGYSGAGYRVFYSYGDGNYYWYDLEECRTHFEGTYTKTSSNPDYYWN
jgi:hypothetical protein